MKNNKTITSALKEVCEDLTSVARRLPSYADPASPLNKTLTEHSWLILNARDILHEELKSPLLKPMYFMFGSKTVELFDANAHQEILQNGFAYSVDYRVIEFVAGSTSPVELLKAYNTYPYWTEISKQDYMWLSALQQLPITNQNIVNDEET